MVSPNNHVVDFGHMGSSSVGKLALSSALIQSSQCSEVGLGNGWGILAGNEGIGVGWVAHHAHLHSLSGDFVKSLTLGLEDLGIGSQEVSSLHSWASWSGTDKHGHISILEGDEWVSGWNDLLDAVVGSVFELHDETLEDLLSCGQLQQLQDNSLVWSKHASLSNEVAEEGTDLASGTGDGNSDWSQLQVLGWSWELASELLQSAHEDSGVH